MFFVWQSDALTDGAGGGIDDDDFASFAGGDENAAVRREGESLGAKAGEFDGATQRCEHLVDGSDGAMGAAAAHALVGGGCGEGVWDGSGVDAAREEGPER